MVLCVPDFSWFLILYITICTFEWTVSSCKIYRFTLAEEFTSQLSLGFWTSVGSTVGVKPLPTLWGWRVYVCRRLRIVRLDCWLASLPKQDCTMRSVFPWVLWPCLLHSCLGYYAQQWMVLWINFPGTVGQQDIPPGGTAYCLETWVCPDCTLNSLAKWGHLILLSEDRKSLSLGYVLCLSATVSRTFR